MVTPTPEEAGILTKLWGGSLSWLANKFKQGLGDFIIFASSKGIEAFMDIMAKSAAKKLTPLIESMEAKTTIPPELKPLFDEIKNPTGEFAAILATRMSNAVVGGAISKFIDYFTRPFTYGLSFAPEYVLHDVDHLVTLYLRHEISSEQLYDFGRKQGVDPLFIDRLLKLKEGRLYSDIAIPLAKRDPAKWDWLLDDIKQNGIDPLRYAAILEYFYRVPGVQDVIRYAVKEAYTPEVYKAFGQDEEFPTEALHDADVAGVKPDHLMKEWIAHWELPGVTQGYDMLHRGLVTKEQLQLLLKARDIMPFWREKLIGLSYDLPNRIELRMMARYGLIDKSKLIEILLKGGVDPQYVDLIADMNIAVGLITDLRTRYANGYITAEQIKTEMQSAGLSPDIQNRLYQYIVKVEKPARTAAEKTATSTEIMSAVKKGVITLEEGLARLVAQNYSEEEALFKLEVYLTTTTGSVKNAGEAKVLTDLMQAAHGLPTDRPTQEIIDSAKAVAAKYPQAPKLSDEEIKTRVDTARRRRRRGEITRDEEVTALLGIGLDISLATAYAENDELRLQKGVGE